MNFLNSKFLIQKQTFFNFFRIVFFFRSHIRIAIGKKDLHFRHTEFFGKI